MWLSIILHLLIAGIVATASAIAGRMFAIPFWVGGSAGLTLYVLILAITRLSERSEREVPLEVDEGS